jgi:hypothetical protein
MHALVARDEGGVMDLRKTLALTGSAILMVGVFMPIVSLPIIGTMTFFNNGEGDGTIVLALGAISLLLVLANRIHLLVVTGLYSLAILGRTFYNIQSRLAEIRTSMERDQAGNPFAGLKRSMMEGVQLQWGWALLVAGAGLLLAAAAMRPSKQLVKCPHCAELIQPDANICKHCKRDARSGPVLL